jgi:hypothetical protein
MKLGVDPCTIDAPKGIVGVLCSFEDEQYPSNSVNPWCLIIEYLNERINFLVGFGKVMQYPSVCEKICYWNPMYFWDTLRRVLHVHWIFLGMNNTLLIVKTKIIQPMVFIV